ncbi:MAG: O-GlcNAc transferase, partial [Bacteroidota bacterium]|nr:O-GlcNAc transferase [Bacteroidota bacterium]
MIEDSASERWKYYSALAIIVLISFFAYIPVFQNGFVLWDDDIYIQNNPLIYSINLKEIFSKYVLGNYHPLTILTLAIEYHFFGLNETGYHAVNLLFHLMNVILVFYAVFILSEKAGVALVASLFFGIHPMHVESVAWAAELKDLLYTFFFLASYILYMKYLKERRKNFYIFALLLFLASLLSKAMAASLPVVLILTDYFKGRIINFASLRDKIPFFLLAVAFGIVAVLAQKSFGATDVVNFTFAQRLVFACYGFISYLFKLFFPLNLSAYYPYPVNSGESIPIQYYAYFILFAGLVTAIIYSIRVTKKIFFGTGFFAITIFLVLQLYPVGGAIMADRYSYIPSIGIFYLAGEGFILLWNKKLKIINVVFLVAFTVFFSVRTYARCGIWNNTMTLWNDVISQYQTIPFVYNNRGNAFVAEKQYDRAFDDFNKAIELDPNYYLAYYNRGNFFMGEKQYERAYTEFSKVINLN